MIECVNAVTLATHDMARTVEFYRALGFPVIYGGVAAPLTSFRAGTGYLNVMAQPPERQWSWWGRGRPPRPQAKVYPRVDPRGGRMETGPRQLHRGHEGA